jgi:hypothetical protein
VDNIFNLMKIVILPEIPPDSSVLVTDLTIHDARMGRHFGLGIKTLQTSSACQAFVVTLTSSGFSIDVGNSF